MTTTPPPTFGAIRSPIADKDGRLHRDWQKKFQEWEAKLWQTIDLVGQIAANAKIQGRTEGIGTTVGKLDANGIVLAAGADFSRAYLNKNTDNITDGTGSPLSGGARGFIALDVNNRLANTRRATMALASYTPTTQPVTQHLLTTQIDIAASTQKFPDGDISYNSGTVDPGAFGTYYVYCDDPLFAGGAVAYQASTSNPLVTANEGRSYFGKITTLGGGGGIGSGGGGGACFTGNTRVITKDGIKAIRDVLPGDEILTLRGWRQVAKTLEHHFAGNLRDMGGDEYVTPRHAFWHGREWRRAEELFLPSIHFEACLVYNLSVLGDGSDDEQCYALANGWIAHNQIKF